MKRKALVLALTLGTFVLGFAAGLGLSIPLRDRYVASLNLAHERVKQGVCETALALLEQGEVNEAASILREVTDASEQKIAKLKE